VNYDGRGKHFGGSAQAGITGKKQWVRPVYLVTTRKIDIENKSFSKGKKDRRGGLGLSKEEEDRAAPSMGYKKLSLKRFVGPR